MEAVGVAASIIAIVQLTGSCLKIGGKLIGPSKYASKDLEVVSSTLYSLNGTITNLQLHYRIHEDDEARLAAFNILEVPLKRCQEALVLIEERLNNIGLIGKHLVGASFDSRLKRALIDVTESRLLFDMALQADQKVILSAVERYLRTVGEDVRDLSKDVNDNFKILQDLNEQQAKNHEQVGSWHHEVQDHINQSKKILLESGDRWRKESERRDQDLETRKLFDWLSPLNFWTNHDDALSRRYELTGEWLIESYRFQNWVTGKTQTLLCLGMPGAGKTVITSVVADHLQSISRQGNTAVAMVYFTYKERQEQSIANIYGSILQQLLHRSSSIPDELWKLYRDYTWKNKHLSTTLCLDLVKRASRGFSKVFIVVDALDECCDGIRDSFLNGMTSLQPGVQLFFTSRSGTPIEHALDGTESLEIRASQEDIRVYVGGRLQTETRLSRMVQGAPTLQDSILERITEQANGMFLLAQLHMDSLARKLTVKQVREELRNLPEEINRTYDSAIDRIANQNKEDRFLAFQVISWITYARRPLLVDELRHALAIDPGNREFDPEALPDQEYLISTCAGLVTTDKQTQSDMANACLAYLTYPPIGRKTGRRRPIFDEDMKERQLQKLPFLAYACTYWGEHVRDVPEDSIHDMAIRFFEQRNNVSFCIWLRHYINDHENLKNLNVDGLAAASSLGFYAIVNSLLSRGANPNTPIDTGARSHKEDLSSGCTIFKGVALHSAAFQGHNAIVSLLLDFGANIREQDSTCRLSVLHSAVEGGQESVVRLLLQRGADPNAKERWGDAPLHKAVNLGFDSVAQTLVAHGAQLELGNAAGARPLHLARHQSTVVSLIEMGAQLESKNDVGWTPLETACYHQLKDTVLTLLERGADTKTALNLLSFQDKGPDSRHEVLHLLLAHGANLEARDTRGDTPLHTAVRFECKGSWDYGDSKSKYRTRSLLEAGAAVSAANAEGRTPLHTAAYQQDDDLVKLLARHGADLDVKDKGGFTPRTILSHNFCFEALEDANRVS